MAKRKGPENSWCVGENFRAERARERMVGGSHC